MLKPASDLDLLVNQFHDATPENYNTDLENVARSKYEELQSLKVSNKNKSLSLFHTNACSINKQFDNFQHLLNCTNKDFDIIATFESRITQNTSILGNVNIKIYFLEFTPT